jgi:predicted O-methyltransferase YrrM
MLEGGLAFSRAGDRIPIHSANDLGHAEALYRTVLENRPAIVLEVGMAFGVSSLAILAALRDSGQKGRLISIDPFQSSDWKGCGSEAINRAGLSEQHQLLEEFDLNALPRLLLAGLKIDFAYLDGWHTFDYTLLDWWYVDRMLAAGGIVAFNDCNWPAVDKVIRFVLTHRKYSEMDVGLPICISGHHCSWEMVRRLLILGAKLRWYRRAEDRYFRKDASWEPNWDYYAPF